MKRTPRAPVVPRIADRLHGRRRGRRGQAWGFLKAGAEREIIGPRQTMADTADYVESHVPPSVPRLISSAPLRIAENCALVLISEEFG